MTDMNYEERIEEMDQKIKQLESQKQTLIARKKEKKRKERTRCLIQIGGIMAHLGIDTLEKANRFQKAFEENDQFRNYIDKLVN